MPHYQASSSDMKQKGVQEQHEESLRVALQLQKKIYSMATAGHQFKFWPNTLKQLLCNKELVYALILS